MSSYKAICCEISKGLAVNTGKAGLPGKQRFEPLSRVCAMIDAEPRLDICTELPIE
jgi:hypothetical protein